MSLISNTIGYAPLYENWSWNGYQWAPLPISNVVEEDLVASMSTTTIAAVSKTAILADEELVVSSTFAGDEEGLTYTVRTIW